MERTVPSVAEALGQAHTALLEDLRKLEATVAPTSEGGLPELRARLAASREHITEHFRFEEQNGYLDAVRRREPRLERTIQHLAEEHRQLARALDALIGNAAAAASLGGPLRNEVQAWIKQVRQHECHENDLVQDAFNLDIGAED